MISRISVSITRACVRSVAPIRLTLPRALAAAPVARLSTVVQLSEAEFENVTSQLFDDICEGVLEAQAGADIAPPKVAVHSGRLEIDVGDGKHVMIERKEEDQALELHIPGKDLQTFKYDAVTRDWVPSAAGEGKAEPLLGALMAEFRIEPGVGSLGI